MLQSIEICAVLGEESSRHILRWKPTIQLSLDCFICERRRRTTRLEFGAERAVCSVGGKQETHYTAARIAGFDTHHEARRLSLRAVVNYWWAPFEDVKNNDRATALSDPPWVRLTFGYLCQAQARTEHVDIQTNVVRPIRQACTHCGEIAATSSEVPTIRLLA